MTTPTTRDAVIRQQLQAFERQLSGARRGSRFERQLIAGNLIDSTTRVDRQSTSLAKESSRLRLRDRYLPADFLKDPQYDVDVMLAERDDDIYSPTLVDPKAGVYQVRAEITQHHAGPAFQGCRLEWRLPAGWSFADGHGAITIAEAISNPIVITRLARYASGKAGWKVVVIEWFRP